MFHKELVSWLLSPTRALCRHSSFSPACVPVWPVWVLVIYNLVLYVLAQFFKSWDCPHIPSCALYTLSVLSTLIQTLTPDWRETGWITYKPLSLTRDVLFTSSALIGTKALVWWGRFPPGLIPSENTTRPDPIWKQVPGGLLNPWGP